MADCLQEGQVSCGSEFENPSPRFALCRRFTAFYLEPCLILSMQKLACGFCDVVFVWQPSQMQQAQMLVAWPTRAVPETQKFHVRYSDFSGPKIRMQGFQNADSGVMRMPLGSGPWSCGECDCKIWLAALDHPKPCFHMAALVYFQPFL